MALRSSVALAALSARAIAQTGSFGSGFNFTSTRAPATACITGDVPAGATGSTVTATQVISGTQTSYVNTASQCDANTLFSHDGATEWAMPGSESTSSGAATITEGSEQWDDNTGPTSFVRVVLSTLYSNGSSIAPPLSTGTGSIGATTEGPFGNGTSSTISNFPTAPISTGISTPIPSDPCAGLEGEVDVAGIQYEARSGADSSINSYNGTFQSRIMDCYALCNEETPQCKGFTYVTSGVESGICYLKSEVGEFVASNSTSNMCSAFRVERRGNETTTFSPSGSLVPTPETSDAPFQNATSAIFTPSGSLVPTPETTDAPFQNETTAIFTPSGSLVPTPETTDAPFQNATTTRGACAFVCPDFIDRCGQYYGPGCYTSCPGAPEPTFTTPFCSLNTPAGTGASNTTVATSIPGPFTNSSTVVDPTSPFTISSTIVDPTSPSVETQTVTLGNGTTAIVETTTQGPTRDPITVTIDRPVPTVSTETQTITQGNGTITVEIPRTTTAPGGVVTSISVETQTVTRDGTTATVEIPRTITAPGAVVTSISVETQTITQGNGTTTVEIPRTITAPGGVVTSVSVETQTVTRDGTTATVEIPRTITAPGAVVTSISVETQTITQGNGTTTVEIPRTITAPGGVVTSVSVETQTVTRDGTTATVEIPRTITAPGGVVTSISVETQTITQGNDTTTVEIPHTITAPGGVVTSVSIETQTVTRDGTTTTVEIPVTTTATVDRGQDTVTLTEYTYTQTLNGTTATVVSTESIPYTTTIEKPIPFTRVETSYETQTVTSTKAGPTGTITQVSTLTIPHTRTVTHNARPTESDVTEFVTITRYWGPTTVTSRGRNGTTTFTSIKPWTTVGPHTETDTTTTLTEYWTRKYSTSCGAHSCKTHVKSWTVPSPIRTKTVTPPVSYRTRTVAAHKSTVVPCSKKSCHAKSTTSVSHYNTTRVDAITASCSTRPESYITKTTDYKTTLTNPNRVITTSDCNTYTVPATSQWVYPEVPCNTTTSAIRSATRSANSTSQKLSTSTIFATSVGTVSQRNSSSLFTTSVMASTTVVPVPSTPAGPTTPAGSSAPGSSPVTQPSAPGSSPTAPVSQPSTVETSVVTQPSAPGSSPVAPTSPPVIESSPVSPVAPGTEKPSYPASQPSVPGSSPASPVGPDTTSTVRMGTTSLTSEGVIVTATRPGEAPSSPVSPEQPSMPVSPEQPSMPVSPEQPSVPVSPQQPSKPVSPQQPNTSNPTVEVPTASVTPSRGSATTTGVSLVVALGAVAAWFVMAA